MVRVFIGLLLVTACFGCDILASAPPPTAVPEVVSTDLTVLENVMSLDEAPQSVQWVEATLGMPSNVPGPTDRAIIAVLEYAEAPRWPSELKVAGGDVTVASSFIRSWFPDAIKNAFMDDPNSDGLLLNVPHYDAAPIGLSPYLNGYLFAVDQYVFVYLFTT